MRETIEKGISERQRIETVNGRKMSRILKKKKKVVKMTPSSIWTLSHVITCGPVSAQQAGQSNGDVITCHSAASVVGCVATVHRSPGSAVFPSCDLGERKRRLFKFAFLYII